MFALSRVGQILGAVGSITIHAYALAFLVEPLGQVVGLQLAWTALIISLALNLALIAATAWVKLTASREDFDAEGIARPNRRDPKLSKTRAIFTLSSSVVILLLVTVLYTTGYTNTDSCNFTVGTVELTGVPLRQRPHPAHHPCNPTWHHQPGLRARHQPLHRPRSAPRRCNLCRRPDQPPRHGPRGHRELPGPRLWRTRHHPPAPRHPHRERPHRHHRSHKLLDSKTTNSQNMLQ